MRSPERVLNSLSEHSKDASYKFERLYRILFNEEMFYVAYQRIYAKEGNMTKGSDGQNPNRQRECTYQRKTVRKDLLACRLSMTS